jgi:hypothetical protein
MGRETWIMLLSGKPFLLSSRYDVSFTDEARRTVVVES